MDQTGYHEDTLEVNLQTYSSRFPLQQRFPLRRDVKSQSQLEQAAREA